MRTAGIVEGREADHCALCLAWVGNERAPVGYQPHRADAAQEDATASTTCVQHAAGQARVAGCVDAALARCICNRLAMEVSASKPPTCEACLPQESASQSGRAWLPSCWHAAAQTSPQAVAQISSWHCLCWACRLKPLAQQACLITSWHSSQQHSLMCSAGS